MENKLKNLEEQIQALLRAQAPAKSVIQAVIEEDNPSVEDTLTRIQNLFIEQSNDIGIDKSNFSQVCRFACKFVEQNSNQIGLILGTEITGLQKAKIGRALVLELFSDVPAVIIEQTIQSQFDLMFGVKHLAPTRSSVETHSCSRRATGAEPLCASERRGSVASAMSDVLDDFTEEEKALPCERIERLLPVATPKTKKRLMSIRRSRRKPDA
jgi:hypothetical protein